MRKGEREREEREKEENGRGGQAEKKGRMRKEGNKAEWMRE